ncbi:Peptidyl-tRNA hydrolase [Pseudobythopirellula maris]|uniref:Peptidyl-tRNA hydrolase n=1 Tax=Pseudobythopirellula maris TaxID=2527991 RepID=A0A5C5ZNB2_9BACT|nr:aminoacyl-tRNA hydrolase [Pseudobythopirellula maris]TWT88407.1 Peptidyl-tRNA hydrolase [Pseudobythopirellula maris]
MKLIVGLGNPGAKYQGTRHNVGFEALQLLAERSGAEKPKTKFDSLVAEANLAVEGQPNSRVLLVWPQTYMNRSGSAVRQAATFYKTPIEDLLIVCDDFHLDVGRLRIRSKGSAGGQNGLKDVANQLGSENYARLRIGVGPAPDGRETVDFVLSKPRAAQKELLEVALHDAAAAAACWATSGVAEAMNKFNGVGKD